MNCAISKPYIKRWFMDEEKFVAKWVGCFANSLN